MKDLRTEVKVFIEKYGSSKSYFSRKLNCSLSHFVHWLNNSREISAEKEKMLWQIISQ